MQRLALLILGLLWVSAPSTLHARPDSPPPRRTSATQPARSRPVAARPTTVPARVVQARTRPPAVSSHTQPSLQGKPTPFPRESFSKPTLPKLSKRLMSRRSFFWSQLFGMLIALGVVVLLIYAILRWAAQRAGLHAPGGGSMLRICDRLSLEPKKGLWVVEVTGQYLLLATHEQGVTLIERLDAQTAQTYLEQSTQTKGGFWERLRRGAPSNAPDSSPSKESEETVKEESSTSTNHSVPTDFEVVSDGQKSPSSSN